MDRGVAPPGSDWSEAERLRTVAARNAERARDSIAILSTLVGETDQSLYSDVVIAQVRGLLRDAASRILRLQAEATGDRGRDDFVAEHVDGLTRLFSTDPELIGYAQHLALEWVAAQRLLQRPGIDMALSPLLQELIGHSYPSVAAVAMAVLAAQTRFSQSQRRMELPLEELSAEALKAAIGCWRRYHGGDASDALIRAEHKLRAATDEASTRLSLLERLCSMETRQTPAMFDVEQAGLGLFATALAFKTRQSRRVILCACLMRPKAGLALSLRAVGLRASDVERQCLVFEPDMAPLRGMESVGTREALQMLSQSNPAPFA